MAYTTINKSSLHMDTKLWTGNSTDNRSITGLEFQPDWVWIKERGATNAHSLFDAVRGANKQLQSNANAAQYDYSGDPNQELKSFTSDGFTLGTGGGVNNNSDTYVGWNWKAGTGQGSSNTDGSINTFYTSVNTTAGFSISKYTGNATAGATIGHGLGAVPKFAMFKRTNSSGNWQVYHHSIGNDHVLKLNGTDAKLDDNTFLNDTTPSSSLITLGGGGLVNGSGDTHICYAFAEKTGYSKFGKYSANANVDGNFIFTGFKPSFILIKASNAAQDGQNWFIYDSVRDTGNTATQTLQPDTNAAEETNVAPIDILSNGFKLRTNTGRINGTNGEYIYMVFAEAPLVGTNNVPCTAR